MKNLHSTFKYSPVFGWIWSMFLAAVLSLPTTGYAQDTIHVSLSEAVRMGLANSKPLHLSSLRIDEALSEINETDDNFLPEISVGVSPSEAFILTRRLHIKGLMQDTMRPPKSSTLYMWSLAVNQPIYTGNKLKYAREAAQLMHQIAQQNNQVDSQDVQLNLIKSYINIYLIDRNQTIAAQELKDVDERLKETIQFRDNGLATENDVLRFKLQKANVQLQQIDLANNRAVANYALAILLDLPENSFIRVDSIHPPENPDLTLSSLLSASLENRRELKVLDYQGNLSDIQIKQIKADHLPTIGAGVTGSWINPNSEIIPPKYSSLGAIILGLNINWNISSFYKSRNKVQTALIRQRQTQIAKDDLADRIKTSVQREYRSYLNNVERIKVLETAVEQARENDRIMELKYQNQLAPTTDRIDAQTMLYRSLVNLSMAHANAASAYYELLRSAGLLTNQNI